jgi:hypothetical protein
MLGVGWNWEIVGVGELAKLVIGDGVLVGDESVMDCFKDNKS